MNERKKERKKEKKSEWVSVWVSEWVGEWVSGWVSEWMSECVSEWVQGRSQKWPMDGGGILECGCTANNIQTVFLYEFWLKKRVSEWVSECRGVARNSLWMGGGFESAVVPRITDCHFVRSLVKIYKKWGPMVGGSDYHTPPLWPCPWVSEWVSCEGVSEWQP